MRGSRIFATAALTAPLPIGLVLGLLGLFIGLPVTPGCFSPHQPPCAFTCLQEPKTCPAGFTCGADGICHNEENPGECLFSGADAATDGGADDVGTSAQR